MSKEVWFSVTWQKKKYYNSIVNKLKKTYGYALQKTPQRKVSEDCLREMLS